MSKTIASAKVIGQRVLNSTTKLINVYAPEIADEAVPGQFVNVKVCKNTAPLLRRPFGVYLLLAAASLLLQAKKGGKA